MNKKFHIISLLLFFLITVSIFSARPNPIRAKSPDSVVISEVLINGTSGKEYVELYNPTGDVIDMSNWILAYYSKTRDWNSPYRKKFFPAGSTLGPSEFFLISIKEGDYAEESNWNLGYSSYQLSNTDGAIGIFPDESFSEKNALDVLGWGEAKVRLFEGLSAPSGKSLEKIDPSGANKKENWRESCEDDGTPGEEPSEESCLEESPTDDSSDNSGEDENSGNSEADENISHVGDAQLNEIFPNPKDGSDNEYIEIKNDGGEPVDLYGWKIKDASKSKGHQFKEHVLLDSGEYFAIYRPDSKIALNNSNESVYLYDPTGKIASSASFKKSLKGASYGFDGKNWRWSKYLTPGKENKFDSPPSVKIKKIKRVYKGIYTEFSAKAKDKESKNLKYIWDFGDGKKSYLAKASHKYLDTGKYTVTLSVSDDSQTVEKSFAITVKKYPKQNLEIMKIVPNPIGKDSEGEIIDIKNSSEKKISLDGWKIATGSGEKVYNHPINDGLTLESAETKTIDREMSKFSLNNKAEKVQLVSPDGKTVDEVEYAKDKIAEGEAYVKTDGEWQWIIASEENKSPEAEDSEENADKNLDDGEVLGETDESISAEPLTQYGYTPEDAYIFFKTIGFFEYRPQEKDWCLKKNFCDVPLLISSI